MNVENLNLETLSHHDMRETGGGFLPVAVVFGIWAFSSRMLCSCSWNEVCIK